MTTTYHYVVLRLAPDHMRGEIINVGIALFPPDEAAKVITMATLNKLRALDASWDTQRLTEWTQSVQSILAHKSSIQSQIETLVLFGFCEPGAIGMFNAATPAELSNRLLTIKTRYVANRSGEEKPQRERKTRLQKALRDQFKKMQVLGTQAGDLAEHLVVPNVPVPGYDELKSDFVYKNGVYRITQTLDYNVSPDSLHNKLTETCVKSTAADLAAQSYGKGTVRLAVVDIPEAFAGAADSHIDLLLARGFEVFHFNNPSSMDAYLHKAAPGKPMA